MSEREKLFADIHAELERQAEARQAYFGGWRLDVDDDYRPIPGSALATYDGTIDIGAIVDLIFRAGYREAIEAAARVAEAAPWFVEMGPDHIRQMRGTDIAQSIRALLPKDAVSEGERS